MGGFLWRLRRLLLTLVLLGAAAAGLGLYELTRIPIPAAKPLKQTTFIYDSQNAVLASYSEQNRVAVTLTQVPKVAVDAVISTEDRHFFTEGAVNPLSMVRALMSNLGGSTNLQGASTITQQYVKQTYLSSQRTVSRKIKEAGIAIRLSRTTPKAQILQSYLNTIYWGRGAYGIQAAAKTYFGLDVGQLDLPESALLAGMIREPDLADPTRNSALARQNQLLSLKALVRDKKVTPAQADAAAAVPFSAYVRPPAAQPLSAGPLPNGEAYFVEAVREQLVAKYGAGVVDGGGLRVTTTLDPSLQAAAYNAVYGTGSHSLNPDKADPSAALASMDDNGLVKALVGGKNFEQSPVDLALGAAGGGGGRQPGSTFKAIMLAELVKLGYSPESVFPAPPEVDVPHGNANGTAWKVTNFQGETPPQPNINLVDATADSVNTVYAQVVTKLGSANLDAMATSLGIRPAELGNNLSEVLGTDEVSPLEMDAAFATFASGGVYHAPLLITKVTDAAGHNLALPVAPVSRPVLTPAQAAEVTYVLQQVVQRGTGTAAALSGSAAAGKTGTTDNSANAWFVGYTPNLTSAVWMGYAAGFKPMVGILGLKSVQGGTYPAGMWHDFMTAALAAEPQWAGTFAPVYSLGGTTLTPPTSGLDFPQGMGTTTTSSVPSTTTVPSSTTSSLPTTTVAGSPGSAPASSTGSSPPVGSGTPTATSTSVPRTTPTTGPPPTTVPVAPTTRAVVPTTAPGH